MDIFENLENLNVSEECFDDILSRIEEDLYDMVGRAEKAGKISSQKADVLKEKALKIGAKERFDSQNRSFPGLNKYEARERMEAKRYSSKNRTEDSLATPV